MKELTKNTLKKWGLKLKKSIDKMSESKASLDPLDGCIQNGDVDGAIAALQSLRKTRKKLKKNG
jgi:hypothetical protein